MNTREAAAHARVTTATIRAWARFGAIAAVKSAGCWDIDADSLARRIALTAPAAPKPLTAEQVIALGGNRWTKAGYDRVYLNDWAQFAGIELAHYNTGNISGAWIDGRGIANGRMGAILGAVSKVYYDTADGLIHVSHVGAESIEVRYLDGQRDSLNLVSRIFHGVRAAAAAL